MDLAYTLAPSLGTKLDDLEQEQAWEQALDIIRKLDRLGLGNASHVVCYHITSNFEWAWAITPSGGHRSGKPLSVCHKSGKPLSVCHKARGDPAIGES